MFAKIFEFKSMSSGLNSGRWDEMSAIERRFSRIARELALRWQREDIDQYLNGLLLDDRGNRQGFPAEILEEIMFLSSLRWQLLNPQYNRADEGLAEQFSFNPVARSDSDYREATRSWVLA